MGLHLSKKKTKSTSNSTFNTTTTPTSTIPGLADSIGSLTGRITGLLDNDPYSLVAGPNPYQTQAAGALSNRLSGGNSYYGGAEGVVRDINSATTPLAQASQVAETGGAGAGHVYDTMDRYMDPFIQQVVDAHMADIDHESQVADARAKSAAASAGAWNGSGGEVLRALTGDSFNRAKAVTSADLRAHGWDSALSAGAADAGNTTQAGIANAQIAAQRAQAQAQLEQQIALANQASQNAGLDRRLQSGNLLLGLGTAADASLFQGAGQLAGLGSDLREIDQQHLLAPYAQAGLVTDMYSHLPLNLFQGSNNSGTQSGSGTNTQSGAGLSDWLDFFKANAQAAAAAAGG